MDFAANVDEIMDFADKPNKTSQQRSNLKLDVSIQMTRFQRKANKFRHTHVKEAGILICREFEKRKIRAKVWKSTSFAYEAYDSTKEKTKVHPSQSKSIPNHQIKKNKGNRIKHQREHIYRQRNPKIDISCWHSDSKNYSGRKTFLGTPISKKQHFQSIQNREKQAKVSKVHFLQ